MSEKQPKAEATQVFCRRLERLLPIGEHADCPYCFAVTEEIKTGDHARFCDFKEGQDPINFGFPPDTARNLSE